MPSIIRATNTDWAGGYTPSTQQASPAPAGSPSPSIPSALVAPPVAGEQPEPNWWDIPAHVGNIVTPVAGWVGEHGGERFGNWFTEWGGDSVPGKILAGVTAPITLPVRMATALMGTWATAFEYASMGLTTALQATTVDNPLYRDGASLDDIGKMWEQAHSMSIGQAFGQGFGSLGRIPQRIAHGESPWAQPTGPADYTAWAPIFDVGFNPYDMTDEQRRQLNENAWYGIGTGAADLGAQVALAYVGNKGASAASRATGLSTQIRSAKDLTALTRDLADPSTPAHSMAQRLAVSRDVGEIYSNPLVARSTQRDRLAQMLLRVDNVDDVSLIVRADRGDRAAIAQLMVDAPRHVFALTDVNAKLLADLTSAAPKIVSPSRERFLQSAFDDAIEQDSFYTMARDSFLSGADETGAWGGTTINNTTMPRGTIGVRGVDWIGDVAGRGQQARADLGRSIMEGRGLEPLADEGHLWSTRTLGKIGSTAPVTRTLQWLGGRKPIGMVTLSGLRPNDTVQEMRAYVDSARWTHGKQTFTILRDDQPIQVTGVQYRAEMTSRLTAAHAKGPSAVAAEVRAIEGELLSSIGYRHTAELEKVKAVTRGIQAKRDGDLADIQSRGYYYDEQAARVMVDPLYRTQLADNIHLMPLRTVEIEMNPAWNLVDAADKAYNAVQKVWRTGILFKPAYTLKNSVAEPLVASILAHGNVLAPDGLLAISQHMATNTARRTGTLALSAYDLATDSLARVPGVRAAVQNTYAGRMRQMHALLDEQYRQNEILASLDAEAAAAASGAKSPAWVMRYGKHVEEQRQAAQMILRDVTERLDSMHIMDGMPDSRGIWKPPPYGETRRIHQSMVEALRDDPGTGSARMLAEADAIEARAAARADVADAAKASRLASARESARQVAENVTTVQRRRGEAYVARLTDELAERQERLARLEAANPERSARQKMRDVPDQGAYTGGTRRLRNAYPMGAGDGILDEARREVAALQSHLDTAVERLAILTEQGGNSAAVRRWNEMLDEAPDLGPATIRLTDEEVHSVNVLRAQAARLGSLTPEERAALQADLGQAAAHLDEWRDALNSPGLSTDVTRAAAEKALEQAQERLAGMTVLTASQRATRERFRERVLTGTQPIVYEALSDGTTRELKGTRRLEANRVAKQWKANEVARATGRDDLVVPIDERFVVAPGLFDPMHDGAGYRADFAATMTQKAAYDPMGYGDNIAAKIQRTGGTDDIGPDDPAYWGELTHFVNRQVRGDEASRRIAAGDGPLEIRDWIKNSPEGRAYAEQMGWETAEEITDGALGMARIIEQYLPSNAVLPDTIRRRVKRNDKVDLPEGSTVKDLLAVREVSEGELREIMGGLPNLSRVHTGHVEWQPGRVKRALSDTLDKTWRMIATHPEERVGRFPGGQRYYNQHLQRDIEFMRSQGVKVDANQINAMRRNAASRALDDVERTYYNIRRYSNPVYAMRYLTAFPGALYNSMYRIAHLSMMNPGTAGFLADKFINGFLQFGVDSDGKPTRDISKVSSVVMDVPPYLKGVLPADARVSLSLQSLDFLRPSPSFAWTVTVPVDSWLQQKPEFATWAKENLDGATLSMLFPFGDPTSKGNFKAGPVVMDSLVPSHVRDLLTSVNEMGDDRWNTTVNQYLQAMAVEHERAGTPLPPDALKAAQQKAREHWETQFALKFAVFGGLSLRADGDLEREQWRQIQDAHGGDYDAALKEFLAKFGPEAVWFTKSTTQKAGGVPATLAGWQRMKEYPDLISEIMALDPDQDPSILAPLFGDVKDGFDKAVYNAQANATIPGTDIGIGKPGSSLQWLSSQEASRSWDAYTQSKALLDAEMIRRGYKSLQSKEAAWLNEKWQTWLSEFQRDPENAAWLTEFQRRDYGRAMNTLRVMDKMLGNQQLVEQNKDNPYFQAMATYLDQYATARTAFEDAETPDERRDIEAKWSAYVTTNISILSKPFADLYDRYLDGNDLKAVTS